MIHKLEQTTSREPGVPKASEQSRASRCGLVTLYNPPETVRVHIETYLEVIDRLYVVDNSPQPDLDLHAELRSLGRVEIVHAEGNIGVASALNTGLRRAVADGYDWALTMDQDSYFCRPSLDILLRTLESVDYAKVAILSPIHKYAPLVTGVSQLEPKLTVMTSGNFVNLSLIETIGWFDDDLFIDEVDHDFCLKAHLKNYQVLCAVDCFLHHRVGSIVQGKFLWKRKKIELHSPKRIYFIYRNHLFMRDRYGERFPDYMQHNKREVRGRLKRIIKYGPNTREYVKAILLARQHYRENIRGNQVGL